MINISNASNLDILTPHKNKALAQVLKNATASELESISQGRDLKSVLNSILKRSADSSTSNKELLQLVKNNPTLKNLGDVATTIKDLLNTLKTQENQLPIEKKLKNFLIDIKDLKNTELKNKFENSGIFLESRLKNASNIKEIMNNDLKALLLQASNEITKTSNPHQSDLLKSIDKLSLQIDNYQLLSHLSNGSSLFLPFSWDILKDGNLAIKKDNQDKFYCDIHLQLKEYGEVNLKLALYDKNQINLYIYSDNEAFKSLIHENMPALRSALIKENITPREMRIFNLQSEPLNTPYEDSEELFNLGFEVKV